MKGRKRTFVIYWVLAFYVFASFVWWSYLLLDKNKAAFIDQVKLEALEYNFQRQLPLDANDYFETEHYVEVKNKFNRQNWMIIGEGLVFLFLLFLGAIQLWKTFAKEISLARQQQNFMLSVTHELKSPLASIKLSLQTLVKRVQIEDKYKKLVDNSLEDVDRLDDLVNNILFAAKIDSRSFSLHREKVIISDLVKGILKKLHMNNKQVDFDVHLDEEIVMDVDKTALASAVNNLVENAIKYSGEDANIEIDLSKNDNYMVLEVKDHGMGIPEEERELVFRKFYRVGNEETRNHKGTGLGLYIVKRVADSHGGKILIKDNQPKGTIMQLILPHEHHINN